MSTNLSNITTKPAIYNKMTIEDVVSAIVAYHDLPIDSNQQNKMVDALKKNWIYSSDCLFRVPPQVIDTLQLPLLLRFELTEISKLKNMSSLPIFRYEDKLAPTVVKEIFTVSRETKKLMTESFSALLKWREDGIDGLTRFSTNFYPSFFLANPQASRLFDVSQMDIQRLAFAKILTWIVDNLDNKNILTVLTNLGARHVIYGVDEDEYVIFAETIANVMQKILGNHIFTKAHFEAWKDTVCEMSRFMRLAGIKSQDGREFVLKRNKRGTYVECIVHLKLDHVLIYKDKSKKDIVGQYPLRGVTGISYGGKDSPLLLTINSEKPVFQLSLIALNNEDYSDFLDEMEWRVQAITRVSKFGNEEDPSETGTSSSCEGAAKTEKKTKKMNKRLAAHKKRSSTDSSANLENKSSSLELAKTRLQFSDNEKVLLRNSWDYVRNLKIGENVGTSHITGISALFSSFYEAFFLANPAGKRLFEGSGIQAQGRALISLLSLVIKGLDNLEALRLQIESLGGRHVIYGVKEQDYDDFARILGEKISALCPETMDRAGINKAWYQTAMKLANVMMESGRAVSAAGFGGMVWRKLKKNSTWKQKYAHLTLSEILIYDNAKMTRLNCTLPFNAIESIEKDENVGDKAPCPCVITIELSIFGISKWKFSMEEPEFKVWMEELNWRLLAVNKVMKYGEVYTTSSGGVGGASEAETSRAENNTKSKKKKTVFHSTVKKSDAGSGTTKQQ